jgi:hypothetical protein
MSEHFSIVVDVEDPGLDVFIAFPFAMETIVESVDKAVRASGLTPYRVDFEKLGTPFIDDIVTQTRGARMVIGICTPEEETRKANPNVMYELGLADSLGKTTLALTTNPETLPADIRQKRAFTYKKEELDSPEARAGFENRLRAEILRMQGQRPDQVLIARGEKHVWVAKAGDRLILTEGFWSYAKAVISLAHDLRTEGALVRTNYLKKLLSDASNMMNPQAGWGPCQKLLDDWGDYSSYHRQRVEPVIKGDKRRCADNCFEKLESDQLWSERATLDLVSVDYQALCEKAEKHVALFNEVDADHVNVVNLPAEQRGHFYTKMINLEESVRNLEHAASALVENLILNVSAIAGARAGGR